MNKYKKIVILLQTPISKRDFLRFGVDYFKKRGFEVYLWDLHSILFPRVNNQIVIPDPMVLNNLKKFLTKKEVLSEINELSQDTLIINYIYPSFNSFWIYRAIKKKSLDYVVCNLNNMPDLYPKIKYFSFDGVIYSFKKLTIENIFNFFLRIIPKKYFKLFGIKAAKIYIIDGKKAIESTGFFIDNNTHICKAHTFDYDRHYENHEINNEFSLDNKKYAIFFDQFLPFHPDFIYNDEHVASESLYYPSLSKFFDYISLKLNIEIIIAAHPRSYYDKLPDYFNGRQIIFGKTEKLVRDSEFIIMHHSNSINYAVIYKKPIIFITTDEINNTKDGYYIEKLADMFDTGVINIDNYDNIDFSRYMQISNKKYDEYRNDYIKIDGTPEELIWEIFIDKCLKK